VIAKLVMTHHTGDNRLRNFSYSFIGRNIKAVGLAIWIKFTPLTCSWWHRRHFCSDAKRENHFNACKEHTKRLERWHVASSV